MGKKLSRVELHEGFFIPGLLADAGGGQFGKTIPSVGKTMEGLSMEMLDNGGVDVQWKSKGITHTITIGAANIKYAFHAPSSLEDNRDPKNN